MLDKARNFVLWVLTPIAMAIGYVYYLITQNQELKEAIERKDAEERTARFMNQSNEAKEKADNEEADYNTLRNEYLKQAGASGSDVPTDNKGV